MPLEAGSNAPVRLTFPAKSIAVRTALADARRAWGAMGAATPVCETAEQVLAEVLNNVVEHAHAETSDGMITLNFARSDGGIACVVRDQGAPMPGLNPPPGELADISDTLDDLPEGGFGWFMIRKLTRNLTYERADGWNHLSFRIPPDA